MLIYCAHKYGGDEFNRAEAESKIRLIQMADLKNTYVSPIHCFGHLYKAISYDDGMELCFDLLTACDELYVLSDLSEGVRREIEFAELIKMPIKYLI